MATYAETEKAGPGGRGFVIDTEKVFRRTETGDLIEVTSDGSRVYTNINTQTEFLPDYYAVKDNAALVIENVTATYPDKPSESVNAALLINNLVGVPGSETGGSRSPGHTIGFFSETMIEAECGEAFGSEFRLDPRRKHLNVYVAHKYVIGPDAQNGGTVGKFVINQFDDMRGPVKNIESFEDNFLDPRIVTTHKGGRVGGSAQLTTNLTLTRQNSGWHYMCMNNTDITVTLGPDVTEGCTFNFIRAGTGKVTFAVSPDKAWYAKGDKVSLDSRFAECKIRVYPFGGTIGSFVAGV
ncbi:virion structural protein [Pseudomonas phage UFV-P2]|uniref:Phage structural protein n=1 Tax=Pseudomonas phage UFV-P2 TaxID=1235661 RepID=K0ILN1_9CAUD|nr:virion structural protein [Pseudomonas phage UFV-P2]AFU62934.1 phage structural protein [Pseudomonas phage UFV-P2]